MSEATVTKFTTSPTERPLGAMRLIGQATLRASAATTTGYVQSNYAYCGTASKVSLLFSLTWVDSTSTEYYVAWSDDGTNWYRSINVATTAGTNTVTMNNQAVALGASTKWVDTFDVQAPYVSVFVKKSGGAGADALAVSADFLSL